MQQLMIYGAGGFAREVAWLAQSCNPAYEVVCFIDDDQQKHGTLLNAIPVMSLDDAYARFPQIPLITALGTPATRQKVIERTVKLGFSFVTLIHPRVESSSWVEIGSGSVICAGSILTTNIIIGSHVQINLDCTIGHDVVMGDYTTLAPGVHVSGCVHMGQRVYIGTGAVILNGTWDAPLIIEDDAVIGAGACVTRQVDAGQTVVGVPARPLARR